MTPTSIIVPVRNKASVTRRSLDGLVAGLGSGSEVEIVVVDDGSDDETEEVLARQGSRIRVVRHPESRGFATSCNDGAAAAAGEYFVFLNNDTVGAEGWLGQLIGYADRNPRAGAIGSRLLYQNRTIQHAGIAICQDRMPRHVYRGFSADHPAVNRSRRYQAVTAACVLMRRQAFEEVEGFDPAFLNGFDDVDLCLRLAEHGHEVHYCHTSVLYHLEAATRAEGAEKDARLFRRNAQLYLERWGDRVQPDELSTYAEDGLLGIEQSDVYPLEFRLAPELGGFRDGETAARTAELLGIRSRQVFELLQENTLLRIRLGELELPSELEHLRAKAAQIGAFDTSGLRTWE